MACSWRIYDEFTSSDNRLRVSLVTPVEEPWNDFLDLRRAFEKKNGEVQCTKRGMRIPITSDQLIDLVETLQSIGHGRKKRSETAGLRFIRQAGVLHIRRVSSPSRGEGDGDPPVLLVLTPDEVVFLHDKLIVLKDIMIARAREDDDVVVVEEEDNATWFNK